MSTETNDTRPKPYSSSGSSSYGSGAGRPSGPGTGGPMGGQRRPYGAGPGGPGRGGKPMPRRRVCRICMDRQGGVDWKAANFLRNFITERGKILSGRSTGTCARCQRQLTEAIKRARNIALIPTSPI